MPMQQKLLQALIVGAYFRPPAKQVLASLPAGCQLSIMPEYDNPYDENALRVIASAGQVPDSQHEALRLSLERTGYDFEELIGPLGCGDVFLGYVAKTGGKPQLTSGLQGNVEFRQVIEASYVVQAILGFSPDGKPLVRLEWSVES